MNKNILFIGIVILLLPFVSAFSIDNTRIESAGLNTNITINETIYADVLDVHDTYIYFQNLRTYTGTEYLNYTLNVTDSDLLLIYNSSRKDIPYISSSTSTSKVITSSLTDTINVDVYVNAVCGSRSEANNVNFVKYNNVLTSFTCVGNNVIKLSDVAVSFGSNNRISLYYIDDQLEGCISTSAAIGKMLGFLGIIAMLLTFGIFFVSMYDFSNNKFNFDNIDWEQWKVTIMIIVITAVILGITIAATMDMC